MKKFNLNNPISIQKFKEKVDYLLEKRCMAKLEEEKQIRTLKQNASYHKYCQLIADKLNEYGVEHYNPIILGGTYIPYDKDLVETVIMKGIMFDLFGHKTSTKLKTNDLNAVIDVVTMSLSKFGIVVQFPSIETLMNNELH